MAYASPLAFCFAACSVTLPADPAIHSLKRTDRRFPCKTFAKFAKTSFFAKFTSTILGVLCSYRNTRKRSASSSKSARNRAAAANSGATLSPSTANSTATSSSARSRKGCGEHPDREHHLPPQLHGSDGPAVQVLSRRLQQNVYDQNCFRSSSCIRDSAKSTATITNATISSAISASRIAANKFFRSSNDKKLPWIYSGSFVIFGAALVVGVAQFG